MPRRSKIGIALSAGGAAAMAQIGVLNELVAAGFAIDVVAGTSAGAMVGATYAADRLPQFAATMRSLTRRRLITLFDPKWPRGGLLEGRRAMTLLRPHVESRFESLLRPFAAVAVDLRTGDEVVLREGSVVDAVRASIAIPGVFTPLRRGDQVLVDGGLVNPIPVSVARSLGAEFVIAVSVLTHRAEPLRQAQPAPREAGKPLYVRLLARAGARRAAVRAAARRKAARKAAEERRSQALGLVEVILESTRIIERRIAAARLKEDPPDFLLEIPVPRLGIFDFQHTSAMIEAGRVAAIEALPAIEQALARTRLYRRWGRWRRSRRG
jgi:NTE family protein